MAQDTLSECLGRVWGGSCVFRPVYIPRSVPGCGLGNRATQLWYKTVGFSCFFCFRPAGGDLGILATPTVAQDWMTSCFSFSVVYISPRPPSLTLWPYFGFPLFRQHILAPPPLSGDMAVAFFWHFSCLLRIGLLCFLSSPCFLSAS